jgi:hypothetical protein
MSRSDDPLLVLPRSRAATRPDIGPFSDKRTLNIPRRRRGRRRTEIITLPLRLIFFATFAQLLRSRSSINRSSFERTLANSHIVGDPEVIIVLL